MSKTTFTLRLDNVLKNEPTSAARGCDRSGVQLLRDSSVQRQQEVAAHDTWFQRQVQIGLDSANAGRLIPADQVEAEFITRREKTRRKLEI